MVTLKQKITSKDNKKGQSILLLKKADYQNISGENQKMPKEWWKMATIPIFKSGYKFYFFKCQ